MSFNLYLLRELAIALSNWYWPFWLHKICFLACLLWYRCYGFF